MNRPSPKTALDYEISRRTGIHIRRVGTVLGAFYRLIQEDLVEFGESRIPYVGTLRCYVKKADQNVVLTQGPFSNKRHKRRIHVRNQIRIYFSKAPQLRAALKEEHMDKYAVDESVDQESLEKKAAGGCPACGSKLEKHGHVLMCPKHGSEPFEKEAWPQGNKPSPQRQNPKSR
jgi:transcription initiation factor IIE alpha subunit